MATGYHDDSNNPRYNFVPHRAGSAAERGIPALGKLVYRTDTPGFEYCSSTSPNATTNGGGTWEPLSGGGGFADGLFSSVVKQGVTVSVDPTSQPGLEYRYSTKTFDCSFSLSITSTGTSGSIVTVSLPQFGQVVNNANGLYIRGYGVAYHGSTTTPVFIHPYANWGLGVGGANPTVYFIPMNDIGLSYGVSPAIALTSGDLLVGNISCLVSP